MVAKEAMAIEEVIDEGAVIEEVIDEGAAIEEVIDEGAAIEEAIDEGAAIEGVSPLTDGMTEGARYQYGPHSDLGGSYYNTAGFPVDACPRSK